MDLANAYRGKTVLVTGDTGFKGSWLATWLGELAAKVVGFALPPAGPRDNYVLCDVRSRIAHVDGDVRDREAVARVIAAHQPEVVFHLAAQALVLESYKDPVTTFATNVMGVVNLLDAARAVPSVRAVVVVTSDKCYEATGLDRGYRETDPMGGHDPYSASKGAAELVVSSMRRSFFYRPDAPVVASARAGNVIGGGDWGTHRIIPDCVRALAAGEPIVLRNPQSVRPWQHVLDALHGYLYLGAKLLSGSDEYASGWNFGPAAESMVPVRELVEAMIAAWGSGSFRVDESPHKPVEAKLLHLDIAKAREQLGWAPRLTLAQAVRMTVEGYRAEGLPPAELYAHRAQQIRQFMGAT